MGGGSGRAAACRNCPCLEPALDSPWMATGGGTTIDAPNGHPSPPEGGRGATAVRLEDVRRSYGEVAAR